MLLTPIRNVLVSVALAGLAAAAPALAQDVGESHLEAAREAIDAIDATDRYDAILPQVAESLKAQLIANNPDLEVQILTFVDEAALALAARRADLEREAAMVYARAIAEEDLRAIAQFYRTDAGRSLLRNGPIAARQVTQAAAVWQRGIERDLLEVVSTRLGDAGLRQRPADAEATNQ